MKNLETLDKFYQYAFPMLTVLVTCNDNKQNTNIITISWQTTLSKNPPLYGIALHRKRYSYKLIQGTQEFVVNFLSDKYLTDVHFCGTHSGKNTEKIKHTKLTFTPSKLLATPRITEAYAHFECKLEDSISVGDHELLVGKVINASADPQVFTNELLNIEKIQPIYYRGSNSYLKLEKTAIRKF
jgi:flavin reductase (DIM6/NTAB) family NADH-FMN oxidoreductase RutF